MAKDNEHPDVSFAKFHVDEASNVRSACGIQAMPKFQFKKKLSKIEEMKITNQKKFYGLMNSVSPLLMGLYSKPSLMFTSAVMCIKHKSLSKSIPALCRNPPLTGFP
jgi:hypothetical protein